MIIYKITNEINGNFYIGKTTKTIEERFRNHLYESSYKRSNTPLYKAIRKYGKNNFTIKIVECEVPVLELDDREKYWIEKLQPHYNLTKGGEGGDTSNSPNFIQSMKEYHKRKPREEYATYGMLGKTQPKSSREKVSKANSYPVVCEGKEFQSIKKAEEYYRALGTPKSVRKRIDSPKHKDWYRIRPKRVIHR
jgi:group I intron endonuclease